MEIIPVKSRKGIRLRFTVESVRYEFQPLPGGKWENKRDRRLAESIATKIENDILAGSFDASLSKYRHKALLTSPQAAPSLPKNSKKTCWLDLFEPWVEALNLSARTAAGHYQVLRRQVQKAGNPSVLEVKWFSSAKISASTFNRRLSMLRSLIKWCRENNLIDFDPLVGVAHRKPAIEEQQSQEDKCRPFCHAEVTRIVDFFYLKHPTYGPFVEFLFATGVRTGEAVGLLWSSVDLEKKTISIKRSVTRSPGKYEKVASRPKTRQSVRVLRMNSRIFNLLVSIKPTTFNQGEFVFKSPTGKCIDHGNFRNFYWKPALAQLEIPYRKPYATRHTLLSEALEQGLTVPQVAQIAGHKDGRMVLEHYAHVISQPQLPEFTRD